MLAASHSASGPWTAVGSAVCGRPAHCGAALRCSQLSIPGQAEAGNLRTCISCLARLGCVPRKAIGKSGRIRVCGAVVDRQPVHPQTDSPGLGGLHLSLSQALSHLLWHFCCGWVSAALCAARISNPIKRPSCRFGDSRCRQTDRSSTLVPRNSTLDSQPSTLDTTT